MSNKTTRALVILSICIIGATAFPASKAKYSVSRNIALFAEVYKELQMNYVDTLDAETNIRNAIDAMLGQIDPYTEFFSAEEQDRLTSVSTGEYAGIGSYIMKRDTSIVMSEPQWDSPARLAGVRHGDILLAIDDYVLDKDTKTDEASKRLKGRPGTEVTLQIRRPWTNDSIQTITVTRGTITIDPIPYAGFVADSVGYIAVSTFSEKTYPDFVRALNTLQAQQPLKGLIVDLRNNGGGILQGAVQLSSLFVPRGTEIVTTRGRDPHNTKTYKTTRNPEFPTLPLIVLVNEGTASASEIFSGAMQDLDRAVIIGERTYGKGLVQTPRPLPMNALMKITTGRYYLPSGRLVQAIDYRRRNAEGHADRIPDSLTNEFHTRLGRIVRDGGGITPDIKVVLPEGNRLLYTVESEFWAYDFANKVANNTVVAPDIESWQMPDSVFNDFKKFIDPDKFKYDRATDAGIKYLREAIKSENYESDSIAGLVNQLDNMLKHNLDRDLDVNKPMLTKIITSELLERWYGPADILKRELKDDKYISEALNVLADLRRYGAYLTAKNAK